MSDNETDQPAPADPSDAGVPEPRPDAGIGPDDAHIEGAHVLASQAREQLEPRGFGQQQILKWAEAFIDSHGAGDVDAFVAWVAEREDESASGNASGA